MKANEQRRLTIWRLFIEAEFRSDQVSQSEDMGGFGQISHQFDLWAPFSAKTWRGRSSWNLLDLVFLHVEFEVPAPKLQRARAGARGLCKNMRFFRLLIRVNSAIGQ